MARCASWRPRQKCRRHSSPGLPVTCQDCWRPCFRKTEPGHRRCEECEQSIAQLPGADVKLALLAEGDVSPDVLDYLASDSDPLVALEVAQMQDHQHDAATAPAGRAHHHH